MLLYHVLLWTPVMLVYIPSTILYIYIAWLITAVRKQLPQYNTLFYRLFAIQSILDNFLIFLHIISRMLIREGMAGSEFIMSTNSWVFGVFPKIYYFGMVWYFYNTQLWGMIIQSFVRYIAICASESRVKRLLDSIPDTAWWFIKIAVPTANLITHAIREPIYFELGNSGNALINVSTILIELLAQQSTIISVLTTVFSATCYILVLKKLFRFKRTAGNNSIAKYRQMRNTTAVGCMLFLSLCTMTAYNILVTITAVKFGRPPEILRHLLIIPVLLMTFVQPWMLLATDSNLRKGLFSNGAKKVNNHQNME